MLMSGEVKSAKAILKGLQQTVMVITKIQEPEQHNTPKPTEWYEFFIRIFLYEFFDLFLC